ncbi:MAG: hypothetical protein QOK49_3163 [Baekduia sp.]|nr:hypothetical protein [Baekduia sp.]
MRTGVHPSSVPDGPAAIPAIVRARQLAAALLKTETDIVAGSMDQRVDHGCR